MAAIPAAHAIDSMSLELGTSDSSHTSVDLVRLGAQWNWARRFDLGPNWHVGGFWDVSAGYWKNDSRERTSSRLADVAFTPTLRLQPTNPGGFAPYLETGIGAHLLSKSAVSAGRELGTRLQFGSHVGVGMRFGTKKAFDLAYRFQHLSNAGIKDPNDGINFHLLRLQYHF